MIRDFTQGVAYIFKGIKLLKHPRLRRYVTIPLIVNILVFGTLFILALHGMDELIIRIDLYLPDWMQWINWLLWPLLMLASFTIAAFAATFITVTIAAPFNSLLSQHVERVAHSTTHFPEKPFLKEITASLFRARQVILYYLPRSIACLVLFIIPVIQVAAGIIWFLFNAWSMTLQYLDYPAENHSVDFKTMRTKMFAKKSACMGFGITVLVFSMIPIINFFIIPAAVAGATLLWNDLP